MTTSELMFPARTATAREERLDASGHLLALGLALSAFGLLLGGKGITFVGEALSLVVVASVLVRAPRPLRSPIPFWMLAVAVLIAILLLDAMQDNFPGMYPFLLGLRKTVPIWLFLLAGAVWPTEQRDRVLRALMHVLLAAATASLALHLLFPSVEEAIARTAGPYTALYAGEPRLQGVFAGPFHAALAGIVLIVFAASGKGMASARYRTAAAAVGFVVVWQASVRSAWLALALAAVSLLLFTPVRHPLGRALALLVVCLVAVMITLMNAPALAVTRNDTLESLAQWSRDSRFENRLQEWEHARDLIAERPLTGWGAGSAGDTLDDYFVGLSHVTPHNLFVKYAVETGVIGAALVAFVLLTALVILLRQEREQRFRALAIVILLSFLAVGASVTVVDTVPVSWIVMFVVGLAINDVGQHGYDESRRAREGTRR